ncbi:RNA-directed DNA polymerase, eukaryota, Reverse transcriptase zinc-binding domain protein [Artemisia annua]|uniref:RNA-directed DNA polymerase, eukaryota, Reverse transcriptase zinc-binding domain protein n=1 Tax=Artemisia annua TaxID=35608 RepID=A0A2U1LZS3_ARTAN|nr:RNA-directed DNA polymerase, eukaryota, Reverse transcriptase zinc-binding domain protein [Artemisia annua]
MVCTFCKVGPDSHDHLFFSCDFSRKIWCKLKYLVRMDCAPNDWQNLLNFMIKRPVNESIWSILQRLVLGACVYYIWQERNFQAFGSLKVVFWIDASWLYNSTIC